MVVVLLCCGDAPIPVTLPADEAVSVSAVPAREELSEQLPRTVLPARVIVLGADAALAAVLTHLLRSARLDVEVGFVPPHRTVAGRALGLDKGAKAARRALEGTAGPTPLIRDDLGVVVVGSAELTGPNGAPLTGEAYVDELLLFSGERPGIEIQPTGRAPGLRAAELHRRRRLLPRRWSEGRAAQTGARAISATRDGVPEHKRLTRSTFYRHSDDWLLVR